MLFTLLEISFYNRVHILQQTNYSLGYDMPSFDIVSKLDISEVDNAINGSMREISSRYDFKNSQSKISRTDNEIEIIGEDQYKVDQVQQIFLQQYYPMLYNFDDYMLLLSKDFQIHFYICYL